MSGSARIDDLERKYGENPGRYFVPLANEYRKAGQLERAVEICQEQLSVQPDHLSGHVVLGKALFARGDRDAAALAFESALRVDPENLDALHQLALLARDDGNGARALDFARRALAVDPLDPEILAIASDLSAPPEEDVAPPSFDPREMFEDYSTPPRAVPEGQNPLARPRAVDELLRPALPRASDTEAVSEVPAPAPDSVTESVTAAPAPAPVPDPVTAAPAPVADPVTPAPAPAPAPETDPEPVLDPVDGPAAGDARAALAGDAAAGEGEGEGEGIPDRPEPGVEPASRDEPHLAGVAGDPWGDAPPDELPETAVDLISAWPAEPAGSDGESDPAQASGGSGSNAEPDSTQPQAESASADEPDSAPSAPAEEVDSAPAAVEPAPAVQREAAPTPVEAAAAEGSVSAPEPVDSAPTAEPESAPAAVEPDRADQPESAAAPADTTPAGAARRSTEPARTAVERAGRLTPADEWPDLDWPADPGEPKQLADVRGPASAGAEVASASEATSDAPADPPLAMLPEEAEVDAEARVTFVTETMAELLLKQGRRQEAARVYHALLAQHPNDPEIRARLDSLFAAPPEGSAAEIGLRPAPIPTPASAPPGAMSAVGDAIAAAEAFGDTEEVPGSPASPPMRELLTRILAYTPPVGSEPVTSAFLTESRESAPARSLPGGLADAVESAEVAARQLADAGAALADPGAAASLERAAASQAEPISEVLARPTPSGSRSVAGLVPGVSRQAPSFSFDQFFRDVMPEDEGERADQGAPPPGEVSRAAEIDDTDDFRAWLDGLRKS